MAGAGRVSGERCDAGEERGAVLTGCSGWPGKSSRRGGSSVSVGGPVGTTTDLGKAIAWKEGRDPRQT